MLAVCHAKSFLASKPSPSPLNNNGKMLTMKCLRLVVCLFFFKVLLLGKASACSCTWAGDFCESIRAFYPEAHSVFTLRVLDKYVFEKSNAHHIPMMDIEVIEHLAGPEITYDTISLIGQDGLNCAASLYHIEVGDTLLVSIPYLADTSWYYNRPNPPYHLQEFPNCGIHHFIKKGHLLMQRNYDDKMDSLDYNDFLMEFESCTSLPLLSTSVIEETTATFDVFPNPNFGSFYIRNHGAAEQVNFSIVDIAGRQLVRGLLPHSDETQLSLNELTPGTYFLTLNASDESSVRRIIVF